MALSIELGEVELQRLREVAARLKVSPEDLIRALVRDQLTKPSAEFASAAVMVLKKNAELYRRLS